MMNNFILELSPMRSFLRLFAVAITASLFLNACANTGLSKRGDEMSKVSISENTGGKIHPGKFVWHELLTPDTQAAGKFYEALFGWDIEYDGLYAVISNNGKQIAGILQVEPTDKNTGAGLWVPSISVIDVDESTKLVKRQNGKIINGPVDMPPRGRASLVKDPQGAYFVLLRAKGGDPEDSEVAIGEWLWDEVWTKNPDESKAFYVPLLGYDEVASENGYQVLIKEDQWRAGIRYVDDDNQPPLWVPVVRVADPVAMVKRVEELGGVVWVGPDDAPNGNNKRETALIGDPTGALFLIQKWPSQASKGEK